jgi:hypothetical protein
MAEKDSPDFQGKLFVSFSSLDSSKGESEREREEDMIHRSIVH